MLLHYRFWGYAAVVCIGMAMLVQCQNQSWALARQPRSCSYLWDISINVMLQNCVCVSFFFASLTMWTGVGLHGKLVQNPHKAPVMQYDTSVDAKMKSSQLSESICTISLQYGSKIIVGCCKVSIAKYERGRFLPCTSNTNKSFKSTQHSSCTI